MIRYPGTCRKFSSLISPLSSFMYLRQDAGKVSKSAILRGVDKQTKQNKTTSRPPKPALYTRPGNGNLAREKIFKQII